MGLFIPRGRYDPSIPWEEDFEIAWRESAFRDSTALSDDTGDTIILYGIGPIHIIPYTHTPGNPGSYPSYARCANNALRLVPKMTYGSCGKCNATDVKNSCGSHAKCAMAVTKPYFAEKSKMHAKPSPTGNARRAQIFNGICRAECTKNVVKRPRSQM